MKIRQSYDLFIEDILGLNSNSDRKDQNTAIELTDSKKGQSQFSIKVIGWHIFETAIKLLFVIPS